MLDKKTLRDHYYTLLVDFMDDPARAKRAWNRLKRGENANQYIYYLGTQYARYTFDAGAVLARKTRSRIVFREFAKAKNRTPDGQLELESVIYNTFFMLNIDRFTPCDEIDTGINLPDVTHTDYPPYTTVTLPKRRITALIKWLEAESEPYFDASCAFDTYTAMYAVSPSKGTGYLADIKQSDAWPLVNMKLRKWYEDVINAVARQTHAKPEQVANIGKDTAERTIRDSAGNIIHEAQNKRTPEQLRQCVDYLMHQIDNTFKYPETAQLDDIPEPKKIIDAETGIEMYDLKQERIEKLFLQIEREYKGIYDTVVGWKTEITYQPIDSFTNKLHNTVFDSDDEHLFTLSPKHKTNLSVTPNITPGTPTASPWDNHTPIKFDRFDRAVLRTVSSIYELAMEKDPDTLPAITVNEIYRNMTGRDDVSNADKLFEEIRASMVKYLSYARLDPDAYNKAFPDSTDRLPENLAYIYEHLIDWKPAELRSDTGTLVPAFMIMHRPLPKTTADATKQITSFPTEQLAIKDIYRPDDVGGGQDPRMKWRGYERMDKEKIAIVDYLRTYIRIVEHERKKKKRAADDAHFQFPNEINFDTLIKQCDLDMDVANPRMKRKRVRDWVYKSLNSWQYDAVIWGYDPIYTRGRETGVKFYLTDPTKKKKKKNV